MGSSYHYHCCMYCDTGHMLLLYSPVLSKTTWKGWQEGYERRRLEISAAVGIGVQRKGISVLVLILNKKKYFLGL